MKTKTRNNFIVVFLTIFVVLALIGFSYSSFATALPGQQISTTKISVGDSTQVFALADTNYLQGGHMQVPNRHTLLHDGGGSGAWADTGTLTSQRRSVGMLVTVVDDRLATGDPTTGTHYVTYRLISIPHSTDVPCAAGTSPVTDNSLDGKDPSTLGGPTCTSTSLSANWRVVIPDMTGASGSFLQTDGSGNVTLGAGGGGGSGTVTSITAGSGLSGGTITGSGTISLDMASANTWTAQQTFAGSTAPILQMFAGLGTDAGVLYTTSTGLMSRVASTNAHYVLHSSADGTPSWSAVDLSSEVTGVLPLSSLDVSGLSVGSMLYINGSGALGELTIGTSGKILTVVGGQPAWADNKGGAITFGSTTFPTAPSGFPTDGGGATDLQTFVYNAFFPAVGPAGTLSGGGTVEWGASTSLTLSYTVTRHRYAVSALSIAGPSTSTITACASGGQCPAGADTTTNAYTKVIAIDASTIGASGADGNSQGTYTRAATTAANTDSTFTLTVTPSTTPPVATGTLTTTRTYLPKVYYGTSSANLMDTVAYPDDGTNLASPDTGGLWAAIRGLSGSSLQSTRAVSTTAFTGASVYVYFAWPTYHAPTATFAHEPSAGCKSIDTTGAATAGTVSCFSSGTSSTTLFALTDMMHRTVTNFHNAQDAAISYELYRAHFTTSGAGETVYYRVQ